MMFPGRDELIVAPVDWPTRLAPGTVSIVASDFPEDLAEIGEGEGLAKLDQGNFTPALAIPQRQIIGNPVKLDTDRPTRGFAQVWRAEVQSLSTGQATKCWMLRIIGSEAGAPLELVAEENLRDRLCLCEGTPVKVSIWEAQSDWMPQPPDEIIADWCEAARHVEDGFGPEKAMGYLIGEKFLIFLEVAETNDDWRRAIPSFVAEIQELFEPWQLAQFLKTPRRLGALGHTADDEGHRMLRANLDDSEKAGEDARNLLLLETAMELLLGESDV
jgi:hypothetical protein